MTDQDTAQMEQVRHGAGWWYAMAARAGLTPLRQPDDTSARSPLRLSGFQRPPGPEVAR
jgi:hypothetical protein